MGTLTGFLVGGRAAGEGESCLVHVCPSLVLSTDLSAPTVSYIHTSGLERILPPLPHIHLPPKSKDYLHWDGNSAKSWEKSLGYRERELSGAH